MDLMTARDRALKLDAGALADLGREFLASPAAKFLVTELGGVPLELAAVMAALYSGQWPPIVWPLPEPDQRRLGIKPGMKPRLQFWAGLRTVNEAARFAPRGLPSRDAWTAVVQIHAVGLRPWSAASRRAGGPASVVAWALEAPEGELPARDPGTFVYRLGAAAARVEAAVILGGAELPRPASIILEAPDDRLRRKASKVAGAGYLLGMPAFLLAWHRGYLSPGEPPE